jgi:hypothetical protein
MTRSGVPQAPPNPVNSTLATTETPNPSQDLFMNSGDQLTVNLRDTRAGLAVVIRDVTTHQVGSMTASAANGFGEVQFAPTGKSCTNIPYNFHPMYSTSSTKTRVPWAAHAFNIGFDSEIGHFQFCTGPNPIPATPFGLLPNGNPTVCPTGNSEGRGLNKTPADGDDAFCFPAKEALLVHVAGCTLTNTEFDGASYQRLWPNGSSNHPTPFQFSSPTTGANYTLQYAQSAFEADLPAVESTCDNSTGAGCTLIPQTAAGGPVTFYPYFSTTAKGGGGCVWQFGGDTPGMISNYGANGQYGTLFPLDFTNTGGGSSNFFEDFRGIIPNPCPQA